MAALKTTQKGASGKQMSLIFAFINAWEFANFCRARRAAVDGAIYNITRPSATGPPRLRLTRAASASPAVGYSHLHQEQQKALVDGAFGKLKGFILTK